MMPSSGKQFHFTPYSQTSEAEVAEAILTSRDSAIKAILTMLGGDPYWYGFRRASFRYAECLAVPSDPASMTIKLTRGSGIINDGVNHNGHFYFIWNDGQTKVIEASTSPTLTRYDIVCLAPKFTLAGSVSRQVIDGAGNVSLVQDANAVVEDFDITVIKGTDGAADPGLTRINAWEHVPAGLAPIAVVKVRPSATDIVLSDIQDIRETFGLRTISGNGAEALPEAVYSQFGGIVPPNQMGELLRLFGGNTSVLGPLQLFVDVDDSNKLKFKDATGTVRTVAFV
ncbi:hypothetical protein GC173_11350 [bacterium]|nr:hypothetical protein [bacterium]